MNVLLATGYEVLDNEIKKIMTDITFLDLANSKEEILGLLRKTDADVLVVSELLEGNMTNQDFVSALRDEYRSLGVVYFAKEVTPSQISFLHAHGIYDILHTKFSALELKSAILHATKKTN